MQAIERDIVPDFIIRRGIRYLLSQRVKEVLLFFQLISDMKICLLAFFLCIEHIPMGMRVIGFLPHVH